MRTKSLLCVIVLLWIAATPISAARVLIESPRGGYTTERNQLITGRINGFSGQRATLVVNGVPQGIRVSNGRFEREIIVAPGVNVVEVRAGDARDRVSFYADVPARDLKVVLTWDTPTDVDLWVIDPKGNKPYYAARSSPSGGNLDVDITDGYGPETFTMARALPGEFNIQVQYYSSGGAPVTRVNVYVVLHEGTPREERKHFQFTMTRQSQVYQVARFNIAPE